MSSAQFNLLQGLLRSQVFTRCAVAPAKPYVNNDFTAGVNRFDPTHFYVCRQYPELALVHGYRAIGVSEQNPHRAAGQFDLPNLRPSPAFLLTTDRKKYALYDRFFAHDRGLSAADYAHFASFDGQIPFDPAHPHNGQTIQGGFHFARMTQGLICLNPNEPEENRLYLDMMNQGMTAHLRLGNTSEPAFVLEIDESYPAHPDAPSLPKAGTAFRVSDQTIIPQVVHDRFFAGAQIYSAHEVIQRQMADNMDEQAILARFDDMIGIQNIRDQIRELVQLQIYNKTRADLGVTDCPKPRLHAVFRGASGTGKTTVAGKLGETYRDLGLVSQGHMVKVTRADLVAGYAGQSAIKTRAMIEKARGGVLFVDEAYSLFGGDQDAFGREVVAELVREMTEGRGDIAIVFAGYSDEMRHFIQSNSGLASRINIYDFENYAASALLEISNIMAGRHELQMDDAAQQQLLRFLNLKLAQRDKNFGNARYVEKIMEEAKIVLAARVMELNPVPVDRQSLGTLTAPDIKKAFERVERKGLYSATVPLADFDLEQVMQELDGLIGLEDIKEQIRAFAQVQQYRKLLMERGIEQDDPPKMHAVFLGDAGTGKTKVASILGKILAGLGILSKGHVQKVTRENLVAGFIGQTALKTRDMIESARGGVLLVDEAYDLFRREGGGEQRDFGPESSVVLLEEITGGKGDIAIILTGYSKPMKLLLESNPGLARRFSIFEFPGYSPVELTQIAEVVANNLNLKISPAAKASILSMMMMKQAQNDKNFGNAGFIENLIHEARMNLAGRLMANDDPGSLDDATLTTINDVDIGEAFRRLDEKSLHPIQFRDDSEDAPDS